MAPEDRIEIKKDKTVISVNDSDDEEVFRVHVQRRKKKKVRKEVPDSEDSAEDDSTTLPVAQKLPELPYIDVPPLTYKAKERTTINIEVPPIDKRPQYKVAAPVEDPEQAAAIIQKILDTPISITAGEAMGISRPLRDGFKKLLSNKRYLLDEKEKASVFVREEKSPAPVLRTRIGDEVIEEEMIHLDQLPAATYSITTEHSPAVPKGSIIVGDPVLQYLESLAPGEKPKPIYVSRETESLRSVFPLVNNKKEEESLLDNGSEILSMTKAVTKDLGVAYNPDVVIHMQSANSGVDATLGLARNVPFTFGDITLFLQLHIVKEAPYRILLGRPFDCLTESVVVNYKDGEQTLTITDPNTGKRQVVPTFARGKTSPSKSKQEEASGF